MPAPKKVPSVRPQSRPSSYGGRFIWGLAAILIVTAATWWVQLGSVPKILPAAVDTESALPAVFPVKVLREFPHDDQAFTQGLLFFGDRLLESTGLHGRSTLREVDLNTGRIIRKIDIDKQHFGEGITVCRGEIYMLTWKSGLVFVFDLNLNKLRELPLPSEIREGWGITFDGSELIVSDGSHNLYFVDPLHWKVTKTIPVQSAYQKEDGARASFLVSHLNELEFINGLVYANIWYQELIAVISPATGHVVQMLDFRNALPQHKDPGKLRRDAVLNGIAFAPSHPNSLFITGKLWPILLEIELPSLSDK